MKIIPKRGLSINNIHAPQGLPVEVSDKLARELLALGVVTIAPPAPPAVEQPPAPVIETAVAPLADEQAVSRPVRRFRR